MKTRSGDTWRAEELDILWNAKSNKDAHAALLQAGYERTLTAVQIKRSGVVPAERRVSSGKSTGISLVMRPDWAPSTRRQLAQLAKRAADGMSLEAYEAVRARILEGKT